MAGTAGLPAKTTSFIGRQETLAQGLRWLATTRLVTLTGTAGVGKTRLAIRLAEQAASRFDDGVRMVTLSDLRADDNNLESSIAAALGLPDNGTTSPVVRLIEHLRHKRLLLVLDNCEHLIGSTEKPGPLERLVRRLLQAAAGLRIVATSQIKLGVEGEHLLTVPPLCTGENPDPPRRHRGGADGVGASMHEATRLFLDRAAALATDRIPEHDYPLVDQLCRDLGGIPLAIELAVTQLDTLTLQEMIDLNDPLRVLVDGPSEVRHHRSLRSTLTRSYELLTADEQRMLRLLSVFEGGFDLDAAEAICAQFGVNLDDVRPLLSRLIRKSLLQREPCDGRLRYCLPDIVRRYGEELLTEQHDIGTVRQAHADYFATVAGLAARRWFGPEEADWIARLIADTPNMRATHKYFLAHPGQEHRALELAVNLCRTHFHTVAGRVNDARSMLETALEYCAFPTMLEVRARALSSWVASIQGHASHARSALERAEELTEELNCAPPAELLYARGTVIWMTEPILGRARAAIPLLQRAAAAFDSPGDRHMATLYVSMAAAFLGDRDTALTTSAETLAAAEGADAHWSMSWALWSRGLAELQFGDPGDATALAQRCLFLQIGLQDRWGSAFALWLLAMLASARGDHMLACRLLSGTRQQQRLIESNTQTLLPFLRIEQEVEAQCRRELGDDEVDELLALEDLAFDDLVQLALQPIPASRAPQASLPGGLTARELEVAVLVAAGRRNGEIAATLHIAKRTVDKHVERILSKLGLANRVHLVAWIADNHVLDTERGSGHEHNTGTMP